MGASPEQTGAEPPPGDSAVARNVEKLRARLEDARGRSRLVRAGFVAVGLDRQVAAGVLAGGIAFRLFLWLLPLVLVVVAVLGFIGGDAAGDIAEDAGLGGAAVSSVDDAADQASRGRFALLVTGVALLLYASYTAVRALVLVNAAIWRIPPPRMRRPVRATFAFMGAAVGLVAVSLGVGWLREHTELGALGAAIIVGAALGGIWLLVSWWLPHGAERMAELAPGAAVFALGFELLHVFTTWYIVGKLSRSSELYGALGAAATLMFWLYLVGRLIVAASVVNAGLAAERVDQPSPDER